MPALTHQDELLEMRLRMYQLVQVGWLTMAVNEKCQLWFNGLFTLSDTHTHARQSVRVYPTNPGDEMI